MPELAAFTVTIPEAKYESLRAVLDPKQLDAATFSSVKRATEGGATFVRNVVAKNSTLTAQEITQQRIIVARPPVGRPPVGRITISQKLIPLSRFRVTPLKRGGVSVKIAKDRPPLKLQHAFTATLKSGHWGVFLRARHLPTKGPNVNKGKLTPQGFAGRFAIQEQFGPSVLDLVSIPATFAAVEERVAEILLKRLDSQLARFGFASNGAPASPAAAAESDSESEI